MDDTFYPPPPVVLNSFEAFRKHPELRPFPGNDVIYFLIRGEEIIYIGQTRCTARRISEHRDKNYDEVLVYDVREGVNVDDLETALIRFYRPALNGGDRETSHLRISDVCLLA